MPSSLVSGQLFKNIRARTASIVADGTLTVSGAVVLTPKANPNPAVVGQLNVGTDNKLYICTAAPNTWTVVGAQVV